MGKTVLVTGAGGFLGQYMCEFLKDLPQDLHVIGVMRTKISESSCDSIAQLDLRNAEKVNNLIKSKQPDYVVHLAGLFSSNNIQEIYETNINMMSILLEAIKVHKPEITFVATGSAAEYGFIASNQLPIIEQTPCFPATPNGLSKNLATQIAMYYHRAHNINTMIVRPFQILGKGISSQLAPGAFAEQLLATVADGSSTIKVGNLENSRDFLDVHDVVRAIWALCEKPAAGEVFNLCSGQPVQISVLLQTMIDVLGVDVTIEVDLNRLKGKSDVLNSYGNYEKINRHCDWRPEVSFHESITTMLG